MANVFNAQASPNNKINRNTYDWSYVNNFTTNIGRITPVFRALMPQNSSLRISPRLGLEMVPTVFPLRSRMKVKTSFFKYPLRALWKDYRDYIGNFRNDIEEPYLDFTTQDGKSFDESRLRTSSLMDYLNLPTTQVGSSLLTVDVSCSSSGVAFGESGALYGLSDFSMGTSVPVVNGGSARLAYGSSLDDISKHVAFTYCIGSATINMTHVASLSFTVPEHTVAVPESASSIRSIAVMLSASEGSSYKPLSICKYLDHDLGHVPQQSVSFSVSNEDLLDTIPQAVRVVFLVTYNPVSISSVLSLPASGSPVPLDSLTALTSAAGVQAITSVNTPYYYSADSGPTSSRRLKISAYSARAYEGIYNAWYRDNRNNPYMIDGIPVYNQWIPSYDGGADNYNYELHYCNWDTDFLTSAVQSPQQGQAPLVGLTTYETVDSQTLETGEILKTVKNNLAVVDETGKKYALSFVTEGDELTDVQYTQLSDGQPMKAARSLIDLASSGISIADLRAVNAYQKFLELNMRKGYSYRDIIEGRFDVKVRYDELLMPEYIGGFTRDMVNGRIVQNSQIGDQGTYSEALGSYAGVSYADGDSSSPIEVFCDEECIILGLTTVQPIACYSQLIPKDYLYRSLLDHFQPEFDNLGFQPITMKEVAPVQQFNQRSAGMDDVFGYQRPWYEYVARVDEVHGMFRTSLHNFLLNRVFSLAPGLNQDFLIVNPDQLSDVFAVTKTDDGEDFYDKIFGQIYFDCSVKLPISRTIIPRLD